MPIEGPPLEEGFFQAGDGTSLFYRYQSGAPSKNPLLLIHGHGEHSGRYLKFFTRLKDLGSPIAAFDLRGCGRSKGRRVYVDSFEDYLHDVSSFLHFLRSRYEIRQSLHLFGHSLGGLIAASWAREAREPVSKLILSSPLFGIPLNRALVGLVKALNRLVPRLILKNPVNPFFLTHDSTEIENYKRDPLIQRKITPRLVHEMLRCSALFQEEPVSYSFPVYILMAEKDYVVNPEATRRVFERIQAPLKELTVFQGFFHEVFNERGQEEVFAKLCRCLTDSNHE